MVDFNSLAIVPTFVNKHERVVCVFPITSEDGVIHSAEVISHVGHSFTQRRIYRDGHSDFILAHATFPAAILAARKSAGWG